jgi:hypothetical protein
MHGALEGRRKESYSSSRTQGLGAAVARRLREGVSQHPSEPGGQTGCASFVRCLPNNGNSSTWQR